MERINDILGYKNRKIYQNDNFFSFSIDSVILANFVSIRKNDKKIVDLCTGNAVVPLILSLRTKSKICGVEIQKPVYDLAIKSIDYNKLDDQIEVFNMDIKYYLKGNVNSFDIVTCNPPYFKVNSDSNMNLGVEKMIARHEVKTNLSEVISISSKLLHDGGTFAMVHRTDRLMEILIELRKNKLEPKRIMFVYNKISQDSNLFFIESRKNGSVGLKIEKPFIMLDSDNNNTFEYNMLITEVRK